MSLVEKLEAEVEMKSAAEGEIGKQGTVLSWTYTHREKKVVEEMDDEKKSTKFKVIEGDLLKHYKQFFVTIKVTAKEEGSVVQWTFEYEKKKPETPDPNTLRDVGIRMTKDIDHFLQNN